MSTPIAPGSLVIAAGDNTTFAHTIPALKYGTINMGNVKDISGDIYGVNFLSDTGTIELLGVTMSRWGGNAVTAYNPFGQFTNAGNDWYFERGGPAGRGCMDGMGLGCAEQESAHYSCVS